MHIDPIKAPTTRNFKEEIMRLRALKQTCLVITQIIAIAVCLSAPSLAQTPTPSPSPAAPATGTGGMTFSDNLKNIAESAVKLAPAIRTELEGPLLLWLERISLTLAGLIMIAAFAKMWRENAGAGADLFWWFARLGVIFALLGSGPKIINGMHQTGQNIAGSAGKETPLYNFYERQRVNFDYNYAKFTDGVFTVGGKDAPPETGGVVGVLSSNDSSLQTPIQQLDNISTKMPLLLDTMNIARGVMSFGDLFLTLLGSFLMIVMRLVAEKPSFEQRPGQRAAVNRFERPICALAVAVNSMGHQFLARSGFAGYENRNIVSGGE
jgi:hypothetical protein